MLNTISTKEKPVAHVSIPDWKGKIWNMRAVAETKAANSYDLRNEDRTTRNEAVISARWANYHNNNRIADRLAELRRWLNNLHGAMQNARHESGMLMAEKMEAEQEIEKYCLCLTILGQCKGTRDRRHKFNLCYDGVFDELQQEIQLLESTKQFLSNKCFAAWEQNNRLTELISKLEIDIQDKGEALETDLIAFNLDKSHLKATYKPDVLRTPSTVIPYETWLEQARFNQLTTDNETSVAGKLREALQLSRKKCQMDYAAQYDATNYQLRRRIYETERLKNELGWQRKNLKTEMGKLNKEIDYMIRCKEDKINCLKCAETRLETRNLRPAAEQARDEPQIGLHEEVVQLRHTVEILSKKIDDTKSTYNQMEACVMEFENEITYKEQSIKLDNEALELHKTLIQNMPLSQVDRNIQLLNLAKEIPPERPVLE